MGSAAARADLNMVQLYQVGVISGCILDAAIGLMDQRFSYPAMLAESHRECQNRHFRLQCAPEFPADERARIGILNHRQIGKSLHVSE